MRTALDRYLSSEDLVLIGYLLGLAVYYLLLDTDDPSPWNKQEVRLSEAHLRRLEDGETVRIERWHGHSVDLHADMVLDANALDTEQDGGAE